MPTIDNTIETPFDKKSNDYTMATRLQIHNNPGIAALPNPIPHDSIVLETVSEWYEKVGLMFDKNKIDNEDQQEQLISKAMKIVDEFISNQLEQME